MLQVTYQPYIAHTALYNSLWKKLMLYIRAQIVHVWPIVVDDVANA